MTVNAANKKRADTTAWLAVALRPPAPVLAGQFKRAMQKSQNAASGRELPQRSNDCTRHDPSSPNLQPAGAREAASAAVVAAAQSARWSSTTGRAATTVLPAIVPVEFGKHRTLTGFHATQTLQALFQRIAALARQMAMRDSELTVEPARFPGTRIRISSAADGWRVEVLAPDAAIARVFADGDRALASLFRDGGLGRVRMTVANPPQPDS